MNLYRVEQVVRAQNERAQDWDLTGDLTVVEWISVLMASEGRCHYCKEYVGVDELTLDHVIPVCNGGATTLANIVAACSPCNTRKGRRSVEVWLQALAGTLPTVISDDIYQTIRIWKTTLKKLRMLAALTGERMISILDRLIDRELQRVISEQKEEEGKDV